MHKLKLTPVLVFPYFQAYKYLKDFTGKQTPPQMFAKIAVSQGLKNPFHPCKVPK